MRPPEKDPGGKIRVLWAGEPLSNLQEIRPYIEAIGQDPTFSLRYRPRPDGMTERHDSDVRQWPVPVSWSPYRSLEEDFLHADVVIGTYSSLLYESYLYLVPSVLMRVSEGLAQDRLGENATLIADSPDRLHLKILEACQMSQAERLDRQQQLWGQGGREGYEQVVDLCQIVLTANPRLSVRQAVDRLRPAVLDKPLERTLSA